jgi:hypothetical protein
MAAPEQWWVVIQQHGKGQAISYSVVASATTPGNVDSGPYATKAEADAALSNATASGANPVSGIAANVSIPNPFSWVGAIAHWVGDLVGHLTDAAMWKSIGWMTLGIVLVIMGILLWVKQNAASGPMPVPIPV